MYEPTVGGAWFQWSALDRVEKTLAWISFVTTAAGVAIAGSVMGLIRNAYRAGYRAGSGGLEPDEALVVARTDWLPGISQDAAAVASAILIGIGVVAWVMFSRRQDELFNRVQNRAYGLGSFITFGAMGLWLLLARVAGVPGLSVEGVVLVWCVAFALVWFQESRRRWR